MLATHPSTSERISQALLAARRDKTAVEMKDFDEAGFKDKVKPLILDLPADASAYVLNPSVISDRHIELGPAYTSGETLKDGDQIVMIDLTGDVPEVAEYIETGRLYLDGSALIGAQPVAEGAFAWRPAAGGMLELGARELAPRQHVIAIRVAPVEVAAPVIDGFTAEQRLFMGLSQARKGKARDAALISQVKSDPHSPSEFRVNGSMRNHPGFYDVYDVKPGDKMYLAPQDRVLIW